MFGELHTAEVPFQQKRRKWSQCSVALASPHGVACRSSWSGGQCTVGGRRRRPMRRWSGGWCTAGRRRLRWLGWAERSGYQGGEQCEVVVARLGAPGRSGAQQLAQRGARRRVRQRARRRAQQRAPRKRGIENEHSSVIRARHNTSSVDTLTDGSGERKRD